MRRKINVGVIGAGHLGKIHLRLLKESSLYNLIGFYDDNIEMAKNISKELNYKSFDSIEKLINSCEMIDIVTPTQFHYKIASKCIKAGKHIFIEKPITANTREAKKLLLLENKHNVKGQVGHVERFNPAFKSVEHIIENPMFIESHRLAEFNPRGTDVPVVLDLMIHDIDIILSVVDSNLIDISASGVSVISDTPDIANARLEFANGCVANLTASRISLKNMRKTRFFQKDAYIAVDFLSKNVEVLKMKDAPKKIDEYTMILKNAEGNKKQIYFQPPEIKITNSILEELNSFANSILNNGKPEVSLKDATKALSVAEQIIKNF